MVKIHVDFIVIKKLRKMYQPKQEGIGGRTRLLPSAVSRNCELLL
jgi:hypothetical protein